MKIVKKWINHKNVLKNGRIVHYTTILNPNLN